MMHTRVMNSLDINGRTTMATIADRRHLPAATLQRPMAHTSERSRAACALSAMEVKEQASRNV